MHRFRHPEVIVPFDTRMLLHLSRLSRHGTNGSPVRRLFRTFPTDTTRSSWGTEVVYLAYQTGKRALEKDLRLRQCKQCTMGPTRKCIIALGPPEAKTEIHNSLWTAAADS